jgi:hypothetical protein
MNCVGFFFSGFQSRFLETTTTETTRQKKSEEYRGTCIENCERVWKDKFPMVVNKMRHMTGGLHLLVVESV